MSVDISPLYHWSEDEMVKLKADDLHPHYTPINLNNTLFFSSNIQPFLFPGVLHYCLYPIYHPLIIV